MPDLRTEEARKSSIEGRPIIAGIDQSLSATGLCILEPDGTMEMSTVNTGKLRGVQRLYYIKESLKTKIYGAYGTYQDILVCREAYAFGAGGKGNTFSLGELGGAIDMMVYENVQMDCPTVSSSRWKKMLFGTGNVKKDTSYLMIFKNKTEIEFKNDNEADAFGIAFYCWKWWEAKRGYTAQLSDAQRESLLDAKKMKKDKVTAKAALKGRFSEYFSKLQEDVED